MTTPTTPAVVAEGLTKAEEAGAFRGYQAAVATIRSWAAGFYSGETRTCLEAVATDLERNRPIILAHLQESSSGR